MRQLREWSEDCRVFDHQQCQHIGAASTIGLLGARKFVTICPCACHWGCPAEAVRLSDMETICTCRDNGEERRRNFEKAAESS